MIRRNYYTLRDHRLILRSVYNPDTGQEMVDYVAGYDGPIYIDGAGVWTKG